MEWWLSFAPSIVFDVSFGTLASSFSRKDDDDDVNDFVV